MYRLKSLLTACFVCMIVQFGVLGQQKRKLPQVKCPKLPQHKAIRQARQTTSA
jgi:hypothetical protein